MMTEYNALAGQAFTRIIAKAALSFLLVVIAAFLAREGIALAMIIIFSGITSPTIRLATMKIAGTYDRIIVSPVSKPAFFLKVAGYFAIAAFIPLVPSIILVMVLANPVIIIPAVTGILLAAALGTVAGIVARGLSEAHLTALLASGLLIVLTAIRTPLTAVNPYYALSSPSYELPALVGPVILPALAAVLLALVVIIPDIPWKEALS